MAKALKGIKEVSLREFARRIGVSDTAVRKAIKEGKFRKGYNSKTGKVDPEAARADGWVLLQSNAKARRGISRAKAIKKLEGSKEKESVTDATAMPLPERLDGMTAPELLSCIEVTTDMPLILAMRYREIIALALDKIKLQKEEGLLVDKAKVDAALFKFGNVLKRSLLEIPVRVIDDVMIAPTKVDALNILTAEINEVLRVFSSMAEMEKQVTYPT